MDIPDRQPQGKPLPASVSAACAMRKLILLLVILGTVFVSSWPMLAAYITPVFWGYNLYHYLYEFSDEANDRLVRVWVDQIVDDGEPTLVASGSRTVKGEAAAVIPEGANKITVLIMAETKINEQGDTSESVVDSMIFSHITTIRGNPIWDLAGDEVVLDGGDPQNRPVVEMGFAESWVVPPNKTFKAKNLKFSKKNLETLKVRGQVELEKCNFSYLIVTSRTNELDTSENIGAVTIRDCELGGATIQKMSQVELIRSYVNGGISVGENSKPVGSILLYSCLFANGASAYFEVDRGINVEYCEFWELPGLSDNNTYFRLKNATCRLVNNVFFTTPYVRAYGPSRVNNPSPLIDHNNFQAPEMALRLNFYYTIEVGLADNYWGDAGGPGPRGWLSDKGGMVDGRSVPNYYFLREGHLQDQASSRPEPRPFPRIYVRNYRFGQNSLTDTSAPWLRQNRDIFFPLMSGPP